MACERVQFAKKTHGDGAGIVRKLHANRKCIPATFPSSGQSKTILASDSEFFVEKLAKLRAEREQVELANAVTRGKYYDRDAVHFLYEHVFRIMAATLKGNVNRVLTFEVVNEIFEEFRNSADDLQVRGDALWKDFEKEIET